ncbi:protein Kri1 homologue, putative [Candida dubliniensis CD36]|uniref:Protein Kri1 homologue, putative n=1 Tax=Candida dubliniensis (strain CD36 / ATCC MYA-646 / CBS 7987 / NCPF 3949 / NRRL Y-17841) TaxID=573826 RepID=B9WDK3_CANDC|nr:protein Kri1 homologue, putative [Candida dubliniensis CD36]CAX42759.1 protein Kri1 homologue, putative [Candida dubliniensis CD36]
MARKKSAAKKAREAAAAAATATATATAAVESSTSGNSKSLTSNNEHAKDIKIEKPSLQKLPQDKKTLSPSDDDKVSDFDAYSTSSSSSEEEDEFGDLITEDVETGINQVLQTIKTNPSKLLDPNVKFFEDPESIEYNETTKKHKPLYISDYNRMQLLDQAKGKQTNEQEEEEEGTGSFDDQKTIDGQKSFVTVQKEEKDQLLAEIKKAFDEDIEDDSDEEKKEEKEQDDDFFRKKDEKQFKNEAEDKDNIIGGSNLPDPNQDQQGFLNAFLDSKAWIPKKGDKIINLDKIDQTYEEEFDEAVEKFENAYNFRYEDPNGGSEIISYARNQATLRRSKTNSRKRQREKRQELKRQEDEIIQDLLKKKKTAKINKVVDRLSKIKQAIGGDPNNNNNSVVDDETIERVFGDSLLNDDFDDADWDNKMAEIFNEQYYEAELEKPTWDDDDDEIMGGDINSDEEQEQEQEEEEGEVASNSESESESEEPPNKKSKKDLLKAKKSIKKEKQSLKEKAQAIVEANTLKLMDEIEEERGRQRENDGHEKEIKFKYREVSPETFGLTTRDIILADDKQLNNFISIKKFAPYRPKELRLKDKRKYTKKKHLQEWKKETFKNLKLPKEIEQSGAGGDNDNDDDNDIWIPNEDVSNNYYKNDNKKQKKNKKKHDKSRKQR